MSERKTEEWVISVDMSDPLEYNHTIIEKKPIVRCRDCKKCNVGWCLHFDNVVKPDGFCAWGVRRDA